MHFFNLGEAIVLQIVVLCLNYVVDVPVEDIVWHYLNVRNEWP